MNARTVLTVIGVFVLLGVVQVLGFCWFPGLDVAWILALGWIWFLRRVVPQLTVRWDVVGSTLVYTAVLAVGAHLFLRWLYREWGRAGASGGAEIPRWKWRWTLGGLTIVLVMFAAGTAAVGIAHQTIWLVCSPEPLYRRGSIVHNRIYCERHLEHIGRAIQLYAEDNGGRFPDDVASLLDVGLEPSALICPGLVDAPESTAATTQQAKADLSKPGYFSYVYLGKGLAHPLDPRRVIMLEFPENHEGTGINVLYANGDVRWHDREAAEALLATLGFDRIEQPKR
jgi:hypothetical protein